MTFPLKPLSDRVILKRIDEPRESGIVVQSKRDEYKSRHAVVLAIGPGEKLKDGKLPPAGHVRWPMTIAVGDEVYLGEHPFYDFEFRGEKYVMAHEDDIAAVQVQP